MYDYCVYSFLRVLILVDSPSCKLSLSKLPN